MVPFGWIKQLASRHDSHAATGPPRKPSLGHGEAAFVAIRTFAATRFGLAGWTTLAAPVIPALFVRLRGDHLPLPPAGG
jgi:hypothetical protein